DGKVHFQAFDLLHQLPIAILILFLGRPTEIESLLLLVFDLVALDHHGLVSFSGHFLVKGFVLLEFPFEKHTAACWSSLIARRRRLILGLFLSQQRIANNRCQQGNEAKRCETMKHDNYSLISSLSVVRYVVTISPLGFTSQACEGSTERDRLWPPNWR